MVVGMKDLTNSSDCLRYSLVPPEKVSLQRFDRSILYVSIISK
jgi:hypothetical protein